MSNTHDPKGIGVSATIENMKIAVITMATGEYVKLVPPLCKSIREKFLPNHDRELVVLSDVPIPPEQYVHIDFLPSMLNSLLKPFYIKRVENFLLKCDYVYYIDSDCLVVNPVGEEIFSDGLAATLHPLKGEDENLFETNELSTACVSNSANLPYYQACFFGGTTKAVLDLATCSQNNIQKDLVNRIVAKWHDESHFNKYLVEHPPKILDGGYAYPDPDEWRGEWPFEPKIVHYNCNSHRAKLSADS